MIPAPRGTLSWWLWWRFSARRIFSHPVRALIVLLSIGFAATLWSAVSRVSFASIQSFEDSLRASTSRFNLLISPIGGRLQLSQVSSCLSTLASASESIDEVVVIRRELGLLSAESSTYGLNNYQQPRSVTVVGIGGIGAKVAREDTLSGDTNNIFIAPRILSELGITPGREVVLVRGEERIKARSKAISDSLPISNKAEVILPILRISDDILIDTIGVHFTDGGLISAGGQIPTSLSSWISSCMGANTPIRIESVDAPLERGEHLLAAYRLNILIMAGITLIVVGLLVSQATHLALRGVLREISILRVVGVTKRAAIVMVVAESAVLSLFGALLGYTLGYPLILKLSSFLASTAREIYGVDLATHSRWSELGRAALVVSGMVGIGTLAALFGAREARATAPYRGTRREQVHTAPLNRAILSWCVCLASLLAIGVIAALIAFKQVILAYLVIGLILVWAMCMTAWILAGVGRAIPFASVNLAARLARGALSVAGRHFLLVAIAMCVAISLMTGLDLMVSSFRETLQRWSNVRLAGDLFVSSVASGDGNEARLSSKLLNATDSLAEIKQVIPYYEIKSEYILKAGSAQQGGRIEPIVLAAVALGRQCQRGAYPFTAGSCLPLGENWGQLALISESAARKLALKIGDSFAIDGFNLRVQGIVQEFGTERPVITIDRQLFQARYAQHNPKTLTIDLIDKGKINEVKRKIEKLAPDQIVVRDHAELLNLVETLFNRTFRVTESVRWIVFVVALCGLVSTSAQYLWERRREYKTSNVIGVSAGTLSNSVAIESAAVFGAAAIVGVVAGTGIGWCLSEYVNPLVFGWGLTFKFNLKPLIEALVFCVGGVAFTRIVAKLLIKRICQRTSLADE